MRMPNRLRSRAQGGGFTLVELLVVIAIIGILATIAIPQFAAYRRRGYETQVRADLKNAAVAQESYFADSQAYKNCAPCNFAALPGFNPTPAVTVTATAVGQIFTLTGSHSRCGADLWTYNSVTGTVSLPPTPCE